MEFKEGDLVVGLGHTGLITIDRVMNKRVEVGLLNPRTDQVICWTSCLKTKLRPASEEEKKLMTRIDFDIDYIPYQAGDILMCINDEGQKVLKAGKLYTVYQTDDYNGRNRVYVSEYKRHSFSKDRFHKVTECE